MAQLRFCRASQPQQKKVIPVTPEKYFACVAVNLIFVPAAVLCFAPMRNKLKFGFRRTILIVAAALAVMISAVSVFDAMFEEIQNFTLFPMIVVLYTIYHYCVNVHISKSLAVFTHVCALMGVASNIGTGIDAILEPNNSGAFALTPINISLPVLTCFAAALILIYPFRKYGSFLVDSFDLHKVWYITVFISIMIFLTDMSIIPQKYETLYTNNAFRAFWVMLMTLLIFLVLFAVIFYYIVKGMIDYSQKEEKMRFLEMQESQYIRQQKYIEDTSRARHDLRQTLRTLKGMAESGDIEGINEYLDRYISTIPENDTVRYCKNSAVNAILNFYNRLAHVHEIVPDWQVALPEDIDIDDTDLCIVIGNILENAVNACRNIADGSRYIQLTVAVKNSNLCIVAVNPYSGKLRHKDGRYYSTNRKGSGIGLSSITSIAEKNGGTAQFHHENGEFFSDVIMKTETQ